MMLISGILYAFFTFTFWLWLFTCSFAPPGQRSCPTGDFIAQHLKIAINPTGCLMLYITALITRVLLGRLTAIIIIAALLLQDIISMKLYEKKGLYRNV